MSSIERTRAKLNWLVTEFPTLSCRYQFITSSGTHLIEVSPTFIYETDNAYRNAEAQITSDLSSEFPEETVCFISPDDVIGIDGEYEEFRGFWAVMNALPSLVWPSGLDPSPAQIVYPPSIFVKDVLLP